MNKENSSPALRARSLNQNSGLNVNETLALKPLIKENANNQQRYSIKRTKSTEKNDSSENSENTRDTNKGTENGLKLAPKAPTLAFDSWKRFAIVDSEPNKDVKCKVTKNLRSDTPVTEQLGSVTVIEEFSVPEHQNHTKEAKVVRIGDAQAITIEDLKQKLNTLKQENEGKKEMLAKKFEMKNKIVKAGNMRRSHIEDLKTEIAEKENIQEELLAMLKPIEEKSSVQRLKQKQDLALELLNTLSFLNFEISELLEKA